MMPTMRIWTWVGLWSVLGLGALGCDGNISTPEGLRPREEQSPGALCEGVDTSPGYVTLRRLNRTEFNNTVRDLLGDTSNLADGFPTDNESADGFINDADVLTVGTLAVERYENAARELAEAALGRADFRDQYLRCDPSMSTMTGCATDFVERFGRKAWRRPLGDAEVAKLARIVELGADGGDYDAGVALGMRAILLSPNFMFRAEEHRPGGIRRLNGYELASRLSYFLWSTMPDDELFDLAESGELTRDSVFRAQVERMIDDPRFDAFLGEFAARWLKVTQLPDVTPSAELFPDFDEALRTAMLEETRLFIRHVIDNDLPIRTLMRADFTFLNERLARHYGIDGVVGDEMRLVRLADNQRGGLLTQGSILTVTSHPNRTSLVRRGQYVLERLLCAPPPPPPANVEALPEDTTGEGGEVLTLRERVEAHRANPECATCHALMDPIGFALENFDATGAWRDFDEGQPIDTFGELPDGTTFEGAAELGEVLAQDERFATCVGEKLAAYALGRSLRSQDYCLVDDMVSRLGEDASLRDLIVELATDDLFRTVGQQGDER